MQNDSRTRYERDNLESSRLTRELESAWEDSDADNPDESQRREVGFDAIISFRNGKPTTRITNRWIGPRGVRGITEGMKLNDPGYAGETIRPKRGDIVISVHTHPFSGRQGPSDTDLKNLPSGWTGIVINKRGTEWYGKVNY